MEPSHIEKRTGRLPAARFLWAAVALWGALTVWLLSDREPTQKEMTFAYRKLAMETSGISDLRQRNNYRRHLHTFRLEKRDCAKLADRRYACSARLLPATEEAPLLRGIFTHGGSGWTFMPTDQSPTAAPDSRSSS